MEDRRMTDEHFIELATARVLKEIRDARRWFIGLVIALIAALSAIAMLWLDAQTEQSVQESVRESVRDSAEEYVVGYAREYAREYAAETAKNVTRSLDQHAVLTESDDDELVVGVNDYTIAADSTKRLVIRRGEEGQGDRRYQIVATGLDGFDPVLSLYRMSEQTRPSLLAFNDDYGDGLDSQIWVVLQDTVRYELRVSEFSGQRGQVRISVNE